MIGDLFLQIEVMGVENCSHRTDNNEFYALNLLNYAVRKWHAFLRITGKNNKHEKVDTSRNYCVVIR